MLDKTMFFALLLGATLPMLLFFPRWQRKVQNYFARRRSSKSIKTSEISERTISESEVEEIPSTSNENGLIGNPKLTEDLVEKETIPLIKLEMPSFTSETIVLNKAAENSIVDETEADSEVEEVVSTSGENALTETVLTLDEMTMISRMICRSQHRPLARLLKITEQKIQEFESNCMMRNLGDDEVLIQILQEWKRNNGRCATKDVFKKTLLSIGQRDVVDVVFSNFPQTGAKRELKKRYKDIQVRIEENQVKVYQEVELPQVIWTDRILPLEELYVNLEFVKTADDQEDTKGQVMQLEELFNKINEDYPRRILIEGGPGYGKTTLCCKLLNDWGRNLSYIRSIFKMVFLFELRYFKENDTIEDMLTKECEIIGVSGNDGINCIEAFENETLLILDGFDELNDEGKRNILPLIQKKKYPFMFVLVTSRRGMIGVGENKAINERGILKKVREDVNVKQLWDKRIIIKGVSTDKIEVFMRKYFDKEFKEMELKIHSITEGEMTEVFKCPLFLILLAMMIEEKTLENVNSKTSLYKEFFNFIIRRNLVREKKISPEKEIDIFGQSTDIAELVRLLDQFGRLAIECLCENKLMFEEKEVLDCCKDKIIFQLGFLTKIPKTQGRKKENFYQPIHKSFLEFMAAFAMWVLFKKDEGQFQEEIKRIANKGLKPTNDSLFYVFLGGLMKEKASLLFQSLISYRLWFNIESICFTNILLEIENIHSFFSSFQPILDLFVPSLYSIDGSKGLTLNYFQSEIHSLILKHSCDRQLIKVLKWESDFCINLTHCLFAERIHLQFTDDVFKICSKVRKTLMKCHNVIYEFPQIFDINKWNDFVSLSNSIESEKVHFFFGSKSNEINSVLLHYLYKELMEGKWKHKNIDRLRLELNESDNLHSVSLLVDLVKKDRINEGIHLWINESDWRSIKKRNFLKSETENLFNAIIHSKTIKNFLIRNDDYNFSPEFDFNGVSNPNLKSFYFEGSMNLFNSNKMIKEEESVEIIRFPLPEEQIETNFIQNIRNIKYLECNLFCFCSLVELEGPVLQQIEEVELDIPEPEHLQLLNSVMYLTNLQVLTLDVQLIKTIPWNSKPFFVHFFSSLHLRIVQFIWIQNVELFSFFAEVVMEGLNKKEKDENNSTVNSSHVKKVGLQELVVLFYKKETGLNELKESEGIRCIQSMLQNKQIEKFCWVDYCNCINSDQLMVLFPSHKNFRISYEVNGFNQTGSRQGQFDYSWFSFDDRFCIKFLND